MKEPKVRGTSAAQPHDEHGLAIARALLDHAAEAKARERGLCELDHATVQVADAQHVLAS